MADTEKSSHINPSHTVDEFVAYLRRVGYHEVAERTSRDRQAIVVQLDQCPHRECIASAEPGSPIKCVHCGATVGYV